VKCSDFLHELNDYLDDSVDDKARQELEEHLRWCHNCYVVCNTTKRTIEVYRDAELYELPEELRNKLRLSILDKCRPSKPTQ
jgi:CRISPR/Cas system-associated protein Cas10 (large subunit of type III CRISPR-Cas system)